MNKDAIHYISKTPEKLYCYINRVSNQVEKVTRVRVAAFNHQDTYIGEVYLVDNDYIIQHYATKDRLEIFLKDAGIEYRYLSKYGLSNSPCSAWVKAGDKFLLKIIIIHSDKLERTDRDNAFVANQAKERAKQNVINTFVKPSLQAIFDKYGIYYYSDNNSTRWNPSKLNQLVHEYLNNTLVKELKDAGVEVKINDNLLHESSQGIFLRTPIKIKDFKLTKFEEMYEEEDES